MKLKLFFLLFPILFFGQNFQNNIQEANKRGIAANKFILIQFTSKNCKECVDFTTDFFYNSKYKYLLDRFIVLTIDVDYNPDFVKLYQVKSVPNIKIVDVLGNVIHEFRNYKNPEAAKAELSSFPLNTGSVNFNSLFAQKNNPSEKELFQLGKDYQLLLQNSSGYAKDAFFMMSKYFFEKVITYAKNSETKEKAILEIYQNNLYNGTHQKTLDLLNIKNISINNISFAHYVLAQAYFISNNREEARKHIAELEKSKEEYWIKAVKSLMIKYN